MIATAFLHLTPDATLDQICSAAVLLETSGVAAVGLLDAADTGMAPSCFESTTLAAAVAARTSKIGVVAGNSALYGFPYHAARRLATIDHLSGGRSGWLLRADPAAQEHTAYEWRSTLGRGEELHRVTEFAEVALELWNSWEPGAQQPDKSAGIFKDDSRIHRIDYRSTSFRVAGPLDVPPSPQRRPVLFAEVATEQEAAHLARYVDVVVVTAADVATATELAGVVTDTDASTLVLAGASFDGAAGLLTGAEALSLADSRRFAGITVHLMPGSVPALVDVLTQFPIAPHRGTLAETLGFGATFVHGGFAA